MINSDMKARLLNLKDHCKIKVRFNDTDMMGIVHFKNYMVYFDDGFVSFMNSILSPKRIEDTVHEGTVFGIKKVEITYQDSAKFGDYIIVETQIKKIGTSSITFQHEIFREADKTLIASVECVRLAMELNTNRLLNVVDFFSKNLP
ncbi:MAG: acyl-CoA thioesterase [Candidatus Lokiarchaeota archaeon]|nr:acyl-CoA thioesterase [Candidatus Lokiarchaeota archaeon]